MRGGGSHQRDHPSPGRGQAIAPTMDGPGKPLRSIVGATLVVALGVGSFSSCGMERNYTEIKLPVCLRVLIGRG